MEVLVPNRPYDGVQNALGRLCSFVFCLAILGNGYAAAEDRSGYSEYDIKAAYLINFGRFVEWPEETFPDEDSPFKIGILGKNPFGTTLAELAGDQDINGRAIQLITSEKPEDLTGCQIVFMASGQGTKSNLEALAKQPILTVGEDDEFLKDGGTIRFVEKETLVKFEINLKEAKRLKLKMSPRLLKLALHVVDGEAAS